MIEDLEFPTLSEAEQLSLARQAFHVGCLAVREAREVGDTEAVDELTEQREASFVLLDDLLV